MYKPSTHLVVTLNPNRGHIQVQSYILGGNVIMNSQLGLGIV
jgi:hypothetical protein